MWWVYETNISETTRFKKALLVHFSVIHINTYIYIRATPGVCPLGKPQAYQLSGYQLSSTIRVSTIINYQGISTIINQGINYHQLSGYQPSSTIRVSTIINYQGISTIINYHQLSGYINYHQPGYQLSGYQPSSTSFYQNFPPPLLATNAFNHFQIQHSFYQKFPPPPPPLSWQPMHSMIFKYNILFINFFSPPPSLGNQCVQSFSNPTFFLSKFPPPPPPLSWQPMLSMIFKYNILFIKISPPPPLLATNAFNDFMIFKHNASFLSKFPPPPPLGNQCFQ